MRVEAWLNVSISCRPLSTQGLSVSAEIDPNLLYTITAPVSKSERAWDPGS